MTYIVQLLNSKELLLSSKKIDIMSYKNVNDLYKKINDPFSSKRMNFRENMAFVLALSYYCIQNLKNKYTI